MANLLLACLQRQRGCVPAAALDGAGGICRVKPLCIAVLLGLRMPTHTNQVVGCP